MISPDQALATVLDTVDVLGVERVPILEALGRVFAAEVRSPRDIPGFDNSAMDGYAVRAADVASASAEHPVRMAVAETVGAGQMPTHKVERGTCTRTMTGAPIASGADAIIPIEQTRAESDQSVEILASAAPGAFVRPRGEDVCAGALVALPGKTLRPSDIGMLAALNRAMADVYRRPRVAIVATGDELVDVDQIPSGAQVVNSSAYALAAAIIEAGAIPAILRVARDTRSEVRERLEEALAYDVVLSTGGVSVGQFDYVKDVLDELGMSTKFHGVAQRPGRPLKFGVIGTRPVFGLPGNPVSTMVCFYLYVWPALRRMAGMQRCGLPRLDVRCAVDISVAPNLTEFVRVTLSREGGEYTAAPTGNQGSGILSSLARAEGLLIGPAASSILKRGAQAIVLTLTTGAGDEAFFEERLHRN